MLIVDDVANLNPLCVLFSVSGVVMLNSFSLMKLWASILIRKKKMCWLINELACYLVTRAYLVYLIFWYILVHHLQDTMVAKNSKISS